MPHEGTLGESSVSPSPDHRSSLQRLPTQSQKGEASESRDLQCHTPGATYTCHCR